MNCSYTHAYFRGAISGHGPHVLLMCCFTESSRRYLLLYGKMLTFHYFQFYSVSRDQRMTQTTRAIIQKSICHKTSLSNLPSTTISVTILKAHSTLILLHTCSLGVSKRFKGALKPFQLTTLLFCFAPLSPMNSFYVAFGFWPRCKVLTFIPANSHLMQLK